MSSVIDESGSRVKSVPLILTADRKHNIAVPLAHLLDMIVNQFSFVDE